MARSLKDHNINMCSNFILSIQHSNLVFSIRAATFCTDSLRFVKFDVTYTVPPPTIVKGVGVFKHERGKVKKMGTKCATSMARIR